MSATLILGTVGSYFGPWGYAIGTAIGIYIDQEAMPDINQQGPRLENLKVMSSRYGTPIPIIYGTTRVTGNIFWQTDIIETPHETSQGGGKGGGPTVTQTSYSYAQSFAVGLGAREIMGVRKIWANGKLIYNMSATADAATIIASRAIASSFRVYPGTETQLPDSLIEANIGAANTPANRGVPYIIFENMQLGDYGNHAPNLEFEVVENGTFTAAINPAGSVAAFASVVVVSGQYAYVGSPYISDMIRVFNVADPAAPRQVTSFAIGSATTKALAISGKYLYVTTYFLGTNQFMVFDISNPENIPAAIGQLTLATYIDDMVISGLYAFVVNAVGGNLYVVSIAAPDSPLLVYSAAIAGISKVHIQGNYLFVTKSAAAIDVYDVTSPSVPVFLTSFTGGEGVSTSASYLYCVNSVGYLKIFDITNPAAPSLISTTSITRAYPITRLDGVNLIVASRASQGDIRVYDVTDPASPALLAQTPLNNYRANDFVLANGYIFTANNLTDTLQTFFYSGQLITVGTITLSTIVADICTRAGLTAAQIDVTALTDDVDGYVVQRSSARVQIEQLMRAFYFDAVESDGKVKFVKRGGVSVVSIPEDDLAAHVYGSEMPNNLSMGLKQEMELPVEVNVQYMDEGMAHLTNSQRSQRLTTSSLNKLSVNLAISMTATKAKQIAEVLMYDAWTSRTSFGLANSWKYAYLEPTDVITVSKGVRSYNVRLVEEDAAAGIFNRTAVIDDANVYTQSATAAPGIPPGETVVGAPFINLALLDIPLLRDQDEAIGFYAAACSYSGGWKGAQGFKSNDAGATWTSFGNAFLNEAYIGVASAVLANFTGGNIFDETNSVTVVMTHGTLASDTELNVLNGANVVLLGSEVLQFKNATLISANTYTLTGLLRGRRGTEWAMSTHIANERFVLLSETTTYLFDGASSEYNLARKYRGVSFGGFLDDAIEINFTHTAVARKPYAPAQLGGGRNAANDVVLNWSRRTRLGGSWNNYADVPLGETAAAYVVEIYSSGTYATLKRTITGITSETTTYTAAQQTTDGLTPGNPVYFIVYQVSSVVGNGYGARGVI
jgi:hypothetical protein